MSRKRNERRALRHLKMGRATKHDRRQLRKALHRGGVIEQHHLFGLQTGKNLDQGSKGQMRAWDKAINDIVDTLARA